MFIWGFYFLLCLTSNIFGLDNFRLDNFGTVRAFDETNMGRYKAPSLENVASYGVREGFRELLGRGDFPLPHGHIGGYEASDMSMDSSGADSDMGIEGYDVGGCATTDTKNATMAQSVVDRLEEDGAKDLCPGCTSAATLPEIIAHFKVAHRKQRICLSKCRICGKNCGESSKHSHTYGHFGPYDCPEDGCSEKYSFNGMYYHYKSKHKLKARFIVSEGGFQKVG